MRTKDITVAQAMSFETLNIIPELSRNPQIQSNQITQLIVAEHIIYRQGVVISVLQDEVRRLSKQLEQARDTASRLRYPDTTGQ